MFFSGQVFSASATHEQLATIIGSDAIACFIVTKHVIETRWTTDKDKDKDKDKNKNKNEDKDKGAETEGPDVIARTILTALEEGPLSLVRNLVKRMYIPLSTIRRCLTNLMGFAMKYFSWIPYKLNEAQLAAQI
jgi:hypothetical protein